MCDTAIRNDFAVRCFREPADKDYLAARMSYRIGVIEPFLWSALQATEKYLKAILLFNGKSTKNLSHNVEKAYVRLLQIKYISFEFPGGTQQFLAYLTRASSRYLERPYFTMGSELLQLEQTVWHLRRYCQYLLNPLPGLSDEAALALRLEMINAQKWVNKPHKFRVPGGYLESLLDTRHPKEARQALVWKNFFYGSRRRRQIRNFTFRSQSANPPHYLHPETYYAVKDFVHFPQHVIAEVFGERPC